MRLNAAAPLLLLALALAATPGCDSPSAAPPSTDSGERDLAWLRQNAVPLRTDAPGGDASDLAPLRGIVGSARVVGLGEATHGTREFFRMKHRVLEYLVKEMGFNTFGIEATWAESERINDYVHGGPGDPAKLLSAQKFWTTNSQEVLDMIEWMRRHNQAPGGAPKVSFHGIDMQLVRVTMDDVEAFFAKADPAALPAVRAHYACFRQYQDPVTGPPLLVYTQASAAQKESCRGGIVAVHALLAAARDRYVRATSAAEYERALRAARIVVQHEEVLLSGGGDVRDRYLAENAVWLLEQAGPGARMVLWAHNDHVVEAGQTLGALLRQRFGADYLPVGFSFDHGSFNAVIVPIIGPSLRSATVEPAHKGTYEYEFQRLGEPRFLLDLRPLRASPPASAAWLKGPLSIRSIGAGFSPGAPAAYFTSKQLPESYDVVIHFSETTASTLLPFVF